MLSPREELEDIISNGIVLDIIVIGKLEELGCDAGQLQKMFDVDLTLKIVKHFSENLPQSLISEAGMPRALNALKTIRDKAIAHREAIEVLGLKIPSYAKIDQLIQTH